MKKLLLLVLSAMFFSCNSYYGVTSRVKIDKVIVITSKGDTVAVSMREFQKQSYENYTRFKLNNDFYFRNRWQYNQFNPWQWQQFNNPGWNNFNSFNPSYRPFIRPRIQPKPRPRPRVIPKPRLNPTPRPRNNPNPRPNFNPPNPPRNPPVLRDNGSNQGRIKQ